MSERREPSLGDPVIDPAIDDPARTALHLAAPVRATPRAQRRGTWIVGGVLLALLVAGGFALVHWRGAIGARLVSPAPQNRLVQQAAAALRAGRLTSPDGRGARELYEAAMARDPDDLVAREGLAKVANAALAQAQAAIDGGRFDQAQQDIELARALSAPVAAVNRVDAALRRKTGGVARIAELLDRAAAAVDAGHLDDGDDSALAILQQAVTLAPDNAVVLERRRALLGRMLDGLGPRLAHDDLDGARQLVDRVAAIDPGDLDLPEARARLADALQRRQQAQAALARRADAALRGGRLDEADALWKQVLATSPDDVRALAGVRAVAEAWVQAGNRHAARMDFAQAQIAFAKARALAPDLASLHAATQRLRALRMQRSGLAHGGHDKGQVAALLAAAEQAIARDELVDPPGDSAYDKLHQAAALAPGDARVLAANHRFIATVVSCIQRGLTDNRLARASACLDALAAMQPTTPSLPLLRTTLAHRWLDYADERIGAGELDVAARAVESARRLLPHDAAVAAMALRIRQARAGH